VTSAARGALIAGAAIAFAISQAAASSVAAAAPAGRASDPTLTIVTSGDRQSSASGSTSAAGGTVSGIKGVVYRVTNASGTVHTTCTSDAAGRCIVTGLANGTYTVTQLSALTGSNVAQDNYFLSPVLGTGATGSITPAAYRTLGVTVSGNTTVPVGSTSNTSTTVRSGRWAVSRYNPPPPAACTRSVALLFDLSASITASGLRSYKTAARGFVDALLGSSTNVTLYTFGTAASAPGAGNATFGPVNTLTSGGVQTLASRINGLTLPGGAQYTNWDAGIWQIAASGTHYDEAVVLTDGDPTAMGSTGAPDAAGAATTRFRAIENGVFSANALKAEGTRVDAVGIANNANPGSIANLKAISGPEEGTDYFIIPFHSLGGLLTHIALASCASLSIAKTGAPLIYHRVGQVITYTYAVTNTSPADGFPLHNITVHDDLLGTAANCERRTLAPGQSTTCTAAHVVTQADLNAGDVSNTAHAGGVTPNNDTVESPPGEETVTAKQYAALRVTKVATPREYDAPGQTISYHYRVRNTGNVTLTRVTLADDRATGISCTPSRPATLRPGQLMTCTATTITTQADVNAGSIPDTAVAAGHRPDNGPAVTDEADAEVFAGRRASIEITKSHTPDTFTAAGQTIDYTYVITNNGNLPLANLELIDTKIPGPFSCAPVALGQALAPAQTTTCTASYTTTAADVLAGRVTNIAITAGTPPGGLPVAVNLDASEVLLDSEVIAGIRLVKTAVPQTYTAPGQTIRYSYVISNTGRVPLTNVQLEDSMIPGPFTCSPVPVGGTLDPAPKGALDGDSSTTCTGVHVTTQADVDAGRVINLALAAGSPPEGPPQETPFAAQVVTGEFLPAIGITKTATPRTYDRPGQKIDYTYIVTNTGNQTLHEVTVTDSKITGLRCAPSGGSTLAPGAVMRCTASHVTSQADVDRGSIRNVATAIGRTLVAPVAGARAFGDLGAAAARAFGHLGAAAGAFGDPAVTARADEKVTAGVAAALRIAKSASPAVYTRHGQLISYSYAVTNIGNVTLHNVTVTDTKSGLAGCPASTLAPGASMTCHTTHSIAAVDLSRGSIFNSAGATARPPAGDQVKSPPSHAIVRGKVLIPRKPVLPEVPVTG
jgi:uncharacterized repeat protein (TIGR01451 family)